MDGVDILYTYQGLSEFWGNLLFIVFVAMAASLITAIMSMVDSNRRVTVIAGSIAVLLIVGIASIQPKKAPQQVRTLQDNQHF